MGTRAMPERITKTTVQRKGSVRGCPNRLMNLKFKSQSLCQTQEIPTKIRGMPNQRLREAAQEKGNVRDCHWGQRMNLYQSRLEDKRKRKILGWKREIGA